MNGDTARVRLIAWMIDRLTIDQKRALLNRLLALVEKYERRVEALQRGDRS